MQATDAQTTERADLDRLATEQSRQEPIAGCDEVITAAGILARVLRAVGE
jgi:hypothetical protein